MITSVSNPRIREIKALLTRKSERDKQQAFVIEGIRTLREAPAETILELFVTEAFLHTCTPPDRTILETSGCGVTTVSDDVMTRMSDTVHPQGVLAVIRQNRQTAEELLSACVRDAAQAPLLLVLENLQDPGNLGTILRSSEAAGATAVLMTGDCADLYNPKVIRSTMGAIFRMKTAMIPDIGETLRLLKLHNIRTLAADVRGDCSYDSCDLTVPTAFLIGNEGAGLSDEALCGADSRITIPMQGGTESLNAGVSAAVLAFEAARQRRLMSVTEERS